MPIDTEPIQNAILYLIMHQFSNFNDYDTELINYCVSIGLDDNTLFSILIAKDKHDVMHLLKKQEIDYQLAYHNIIRLKKASLFKKFQENYQIYSQENINILLEKKNLFN
jgi:hypothetical protein